MANVKITGLPAGTTPLAGTELFEMVQGGFSVKVAASDIAASATNVRTVATGGTGASTLTGYVKGNGTAAMTAAATVPVADISGTLTVPQGGTGAATLTGYVKANGTAAMTASATIPHTDVVGGPDNYGGFYDTTTQTAGANTATVVLINSTSAVDGVTLSGGSLINIPASGVYRFTLTMQAANTGASDYNVSTWIRKNGITDISYSCVDTTVPAKTGAVNGYAVISYDIMVTLATGDYVQLIWSTPNASVYLDAIAARTTPVRPAAPSVILNVEQISE